MKKKVRIIIEREGYTDRSSAGKWYFSVDGKREYICFTLEDTARPVNVKVKSHTCIPPSVVKVAPYERPNGQKTIIFYTEDDMITLKAGVLSWTYILCHGGNDHTHTDGCVLAAAKRISLDRIQGSMMEYIRTRCDEYWKAGYEIEAEFINLNQYK